MAGCGHREDIRLLFLVMAAPFFPSQAMAPLTLPLLDYYVDIDLKGAQEKGKHHMQEKRAFIIATVAAPGILSVQPPPLSDVGEIQEPTEADFAEVEEVIDRLYDGTWTEEDVEFMESRTEVGQYVTDPRAFDFELLDGTADVAAGADDVVDHKTARITADAWAGNEQWQWTYDVQWTVDADSEEVVVDPVHDTEFVVSSRFYAAQETGMVDRVREVPDSETDLWELARTDHIAFNAPIWGSFWNEHPRVDAQVDGTGSYTFSSSMNGEYLEGTGGNIIDEQDDWEVHSPGCRHDQFSGTPSSGSIRR